MNQQIIEKIVDNNKNILVSGKMMSGKTTSVLFPITEKLISKKESLFFVDSKQEYINYYYDKLKENNYNILIFNLQDLEKSESWNPLKYPYTLFKSGNIDKAQEEIEKISNTLCSSIEAANLVTGLILGLFEDGKETEINFSSIYSMLNEINIEYGIDSYLQKYFSLKDKLSPAYIHSYPAIYAYSDSKSDPVKIVREKLQFYVSREKLVNFMADTTFEYEKIIEKPTAIFFIGREDNRAYNTLISMFVEQLFGYLMETKNARQFNFILDNIDSIEMVNNLTGMMNAGLTQNIRFILGTRCINYLVEKYNSYILNLVDIITLNKNDIVIKTDGITNIISKEVTNITITKANITYPSLKNTVINIFNLEDCVKTEVKKLIANNIFIEKSSKLEEKKDLPSINKYKLNIAEVCKYKI